jgi:hypothetical protein
METVKRWQNEETGNTCYRLQSPGGRWHEVPLVSVVEEELNLRYHSLNAAEQKRMIAAVRSWLASWEAHDFVGAGAGELGMTPCEACGQPERDFIHSMLKHAMAVQIRKSAGEVIQRAREWKRGVEVTGHPYLPGEAALASAVDALVSHEESEET